MHRTGCNCVIVVENLLPDVVIAHAGKVKDTGLLRQSRLYSQSEALFEMPLLLLVL